MTRHFQSGSQSRSGRLAAPQSMNAELPYIEHIIRFCDQLLADWPLQEEECLADEDTRQPLISRAEDRKPLAKK